MLFIGNFFISDRGISLNEKNLAKLSHNLWTNNIIVPIDAFYHIIIKELLVVN